MSLGTVCVKTEVEDALVEVDPEEETEALCVKEEADNEDLCKLYEDHQVKDELVLGPVLIHRPRMGSIQASVVAPAASPLGRACSVRLERLLLGAERGAGRVGRHTDNTRGALWEDNEGMCVKETDGVSSCNLDDELVLSPVLAKRHVSSIQVSDSCCGELAQPRGLACSVRPERLVRRLPRRTDKSRDVSASEHAPTQATCECHHCGKHLHNKSLLIKHIRTHSLGPSCNFKREEFSFDCHQTIRKRKHRATHTGDKPFKCEHCDYRSHKKYNLQTHEIHTHSGDKPFKCDHCDYKCKTTSFLRRHLVIHTDEKPFKCRYCDYGSCIKSNLRTHEMIHTGDKPFKCNHCDYKSNRSTALRNHLRIHTGVKPFKCGYCGYRFCQRGPLRAHEIIHTKEYPFECNHCEYKCKQKSNLSIHLRIHTGEKPFKCRYCDYRCRQIQHLRTHERIHTKETPFKCNHCEYKTNQKSSLRTHLNVHTGEKPFRCNHCDYRSRYKQAVKNHEMTHTGEKPFACSSCDYKCRSRKQLRHHQMRHLGVY